MNTSRTALRQRISVRSCTFREGGGCGCRRRSRPGVHRGLQRGEQALDFGRVLRQIGEVERVAREVEIAARVTGEVEELALDRPGPVGGVPGLVPRHPRREPPYSTAKRVRQGKEGVRAREMKSVRDKG